MIRRLPNTRALTELRATYEKLADPHSELGQALAALIVEGERLEAAIRETKKDEIRGKKKG
ncbi:hypothetical protein [Cupriavidus sp. D39]|uniref:hypothetical protein n=1 Tax=Cupriavidus sp. D39 TaxID=2997877 RepID=UPI00226FE256|nr:hypothetical protein [Cupriavidus sp. D39]MCY0858720.1 hypothetical protein [Cupriavidus sp. D39]